MYGNDKSDRDHLHDVDTTEMVTTATQSLTWDELTMQMVTDIITHQVIQMKIETSPGSCDDINTLQTICSHIKGMTWKDIANMIVSSHRNLCQEQQNTTLIDNVVRVTVDWPQYDVKPSVEVHILQQVDDGLQVDSDVTDHLQGGTLSDTRQASQPSVGQMTSSSHLSTNTSDHTDHSHAVGAYHGDSAKMNARTDTTSSDIDSESLALINEVSFVVSNSILNTDVANQQTLMDVANASLADVANASLADVANASLADVANASLADVANASLADVANASLADVANASFADVANASLADVAMSKKVNDDSSNVPDSTLNADVAIATSPVAGDTNSSVANVATSTKANEYSSIDIISADSIFNADVVNPSSVAVFANLTKGGFITNSRNADGLQVNMSQQKDISSVAGEVAVLSSKEGIVDPVIDEIKANVEGTAASFGQYETLVKNAKIDKVESSAVRKETTDKCVTHRATRCLKRHLDSHENQGSNKPPGFNCEVCDKVFQSCTHHSSNHNAHPCGHCDKICKTVQSLRQHHRVHDTAPSYLCTLCGAGFRLQVQLKQHQVKEHRIQEMFRCDICNAVYKNEATLKDHLIEHTGKEFLCDTCGKKFKRPELLRCHRFRHATNNKPKSFNCSKCPKVYSTNSSLQIHIRLTHNKERKYICGKCGKDFFYRYQMVAHEQAHEGVMQHTCKYCNKGFLKRASVIAHEMVHTGDKPFQCKHCSKGFATKPHLGRHESTHTDTAKPARIYKCKTCDATFAHKGQCTDHEKRHAGVKAHICEFCSKGFVSRGDLLRHMRTHTDGKPHKCEHCETSFSRRLDLLRHKASHGRIKNENN